MSLSAYVKTTWQNLIAGVQAGTKVNAINMNHIEDGIDAVTDELIAHSAETTTSATQPHGLSKNKLDATVAPTINEDSGDGYSINSVWIDTTADKVYICLDSTVGAAVWKEITSVNISASVYNNVDQSIANNSFSYLAFNTEFYDTSNLHDNVTSNSRITIPVTGKYQIEFLGEWAVTAGAGSRISYVVVNRDSSNPLAYDRVEATASGTYIHNLITTAQLNVNDYIEILVYQTSGGSINMKYGSKYSPKFTVRKVD
jgi:hypothetical protein